MNSRSLVLVAVIVLSIAVMVFYVQPRIADLRQKEVDLSELRTTISQTAELNALLESHIAKMNSIRTADLQRLESFLPQEVNSVLVARDISAIASRNGLSLAAAAVGDSQTSTARNGQMADDLGAGVRYRVSTTLLTFEFRGEYQNVKSFLAQLENNVYPIKITELTFGRGEEVTGEVSTEPYVLQMNVELYSFNII